MKTLKSALFDASDAFLKQVEEHNVIPGSDTIAYYESGTGNVLRKTWLGFLIPESKYEPKFEDTYMYPKCTGTKDPIWDMLCTEIYEIMNAEDVDGLHPGYILKALQLCYETAQDYGGTVDDIADEVSAKVHEGQLPSWCDELLKKRNGE